MLTIMSVAPIISVLLTSLLRKPVKRAAVELARLSKMSLARVSRRSNTCVQMDCGVALACVLCCVHAFSACLCAAHVFSIYFTLLTFHPC
jgi:hypothetical protein